MTATRQQELLLTTGEFATLRALRLMRRSAVRWLCGRPMKSGLRLNADMELCCVAAQEGGLLSATRLTSTAASRWR